MSNFHYVRHPDHLSNFFSKLDEPPYRPIRWQKRRLNFPKYTIEFLGYSLLPIIICAIIFLINWINGTLLLWLLILIPIFIFTLFCSYLYSFLNYLYEEYRVSTKIKSYPQDCIDWIQKIAPLYSEYQKNVTKDFEYLFNKHTTQGRSAHKLKSELEILKLEPKIEAYLKWRGLNILPKNPYRSKRKEGQRSWYDQFKFTADFVIVNKDTGLMIDIEIDEVHHFEDDHKKQKDERRNQIFIINGWSIIRFTDVSINLNAKSCAVSVIDFVKEIETMHSNIFDSLTKLKFDKLFSKEDYYNNVMKDLISQKLNWIEHIEPYNELDHRDFTYYPANFRIDYEGGDPIRKYLYEEYLRKKSHPQF